jgi:hypothetical protein
MPMRSIIRRKSQLELIDRACRSRAPARIVRRAQPRGEPTASTRLVALQRDGVLLEQPTRNIAADAPSDALYDVTFQSDDGRTYTFAAAAVSAARPALRRGQARPTWKLGLPLRVDARERRRAPRRAAPVVHPVEVELTDPAHPERVLRGRLVDISAGGIAVRIERRPSGRISFGQAVWVRFQMPGERAPFEFVVSVRHCRILHPGDALLLGLSFCGGEDPATHAERIHRLTGYSMRVTAPAVRRSRGCGGKTA